MLKVLRWIIALICIVCAALLSLSALYVTLKQWVQIRRGPFDAFHFGELLGTILVYGIIMALVVGLCLMAVRLIRGKKKPAPVTEDVDIDSYLS